MEKEAGAFLEGYRVLDLTDEKGHFAGRILGDMGADVIKVEPPGGDPSRSRGPFYHDQPHPEKSLTWFFLNANKRGITLNPETPDGCNILKQLIQRSDLVLESFDPGYMSQLELDYAGLIQIKPDIILTSISPFGQDGPYAHYKVTDLVTMALGGMGYIYGDEDRAPVRITAPQAYLLGGQQAAAGSVFALYHRDLTGEGQWIDVSLQEAILFTLTYYLPMFEQRKMTRMRSGAFFSTPRPQPLGTLKIRRMFQCRDGEICLAFQGGTRAAKKSSHTLVAWANDEGYALEIKDYQWEDWASDSITQSDQEYLESRIIPFLLTKDKITLLEEAAKRRILLAPVSTSADLINNPQFAARDFWVKIHHPELNDTLTYPGPSVNIPQCPYKIYRRAPSIGEHNLEIYRNELGLSDTDIEALTRTEVI